MAKYKRQHYLSQMYLKLFKFDEMKDSVYIKKENVIKEKGIKNICQESYFYDLDVGNHLFEEGYSKIESIFAEFLRIELFNIYNGYLFYNLTKDNKDAILFWIIFNFLKSKVKRDFDISLLGDKEGREKFLKEINSNNIENIKKTIEKWNFIILLNKTKTPFITAEMPSFLVYQEKKEDSFAMMTLSPTVAIYLSNKNNIYLNIVSNNSNNIVSLDEISVEKYNKALVQFAKNLDIFLISNNRKILKRY